MKPKVLVTRKFFPELVVRLKTHFEVDDHASNDGLPPAELKARLADKAGILLSVADPLTAESIAAAPQLRAACNVGVGYNNIDVAACTRAGIMVTNTPDVLTETTADLSWALLMAVSRRLPMAERWLRDGQWGAWRYDLWLGTDVHHATLGIFGMGRIGQALARRATGFGMKRFITTDPACLPTSRPNTMPRGWIKKRFCAKRISLSCFYPIRPPCSITSGRLNWD
jgi:gluconate 2-dehydrogenase